MKKRYDIKPTNGWQSSSGFAVTEYTCQICNEHKSVLEADNSNEEYAGVYICLDCIQKAFKEYEEMK